MKKYITEYIQNTILFFIITIAWNLMEGTRLNWLFMIGQSIIFGIVLTFITIWYSRRKRKKESASSDTKPNTHS